MSDWRQDAQEMACAGCEVGTDLRIRLQQAEARIRELEDSHRKLHRRVQQAERMPERIKELRRRIEHQRDHSRCHLGVGFVPATAVLSEIDEAMALAPPDSEPAEGGGEKCPRCKGFRKVWADGTGAYGDMGDYYVPCPECSSAGDAPPREGSQEDALTWLDSISNFIGSRSHGDRFLSGVRCVRRALSERQAVPEAVRRLPGRMRQEGREVNGPSAGFDEGYSLAKREDASELGRALAQEAPGHTDLMVSPESLPEDLGKGDPLVDPDAQGGEEIEEEEDEEI